MASILLRCEPSMVDTIFCPCYLSSVWLGVGARVPATSHPFPDGFSWALQESHQYALVKLGSWCALGSWGELAWALALESSPFSKADRQEPAVVTQVRTREYTGMREDVGTGLAQDMKAVWTKENRVGRQNSGTHCRLIVGKGTQWSGLAGPPQPCQTVGSLFLL